MIKIFESNDYSELEKDVNEWVKTCGSKIHEYQFRMALNEHGPLYSCCVVLELNTHDF